jgi:hypothetical protein
VVIAYLSGQRPGETLNLRRGCIEHDAMTGLSSCGDGAGKG